MDLSELSTRISSFFLNNLDNVYLFGWISFATITYEIYSFSWVTTSFPRMTLVNKLTREIHLMSTCKAPWSYTCVAFTALAYVCARITEIYKFNKQFVELVVIPHQIENVIRIHLLHRYRHWATTSLPRRACYARVHKLTREIHRMSSTVINEEQPKFKISCIESRRLAIPKTRWQKFSKFFCYFILILYHYISEKLTFQKLTFHQQTNLDF